MNLLISSHLGGCMASCGARFLMSGHRFLQPSNRKKQITERRQSWKLKQRALHWTRSCNWLTNHWLVGHRLRCLPTCLCMRLFLSGEQRLYRLFRANKIREMWASTRDLHMFVRHIPNANLAQPGIGRAMCCCTCSCCGSAS